MATTVVVVVNENGRVSIDVSDMKDVNVKVVAGK